MAGRPSPTTSFVALSRSKSRSTSLASLPPPIALDKDSYLDQIHTTASRSDTLTTFDDFARSPQSIKGDGKVGDILQGGFTGLYTRFKASVGAAKDAVAGGAEVDVVDEAYIRSAKAKASKSTASVALISPTTASALTSQLQSPLTTKSLEAQTILPSQAASSTGFVQSKPSALSPSPRTDPSPRAVPYSLEGVDLSSGHQTISHSLEDSRQILSLSQSSGSAPSPVLNPMGHTRDQDGSFHGTGPSEGPLPSMFNKANRRGAPQSLNGTQLEAFQTTRQDSENDSPYADHSVAAFDPEQTPRNPARRTAERPEPDDGNKVSPNLAPFPRPISIQNMPALHEAHIRLQPGSSREQNSADRRLSLTHVSPSYLPGFQAANDSSDGELSSVATAVAPTPRPDFEAMGVGRGMGADIYSAVPADTTSRMRNKILAKELWMRDENAKDCFYCGDTFSAFRRKHHCRICGNIFDAKCTTLASGRLFGQSGRLRICRPCEGIVHGTDDDSSVYTDDADRVSIAGISFSPRSAAGIDHFATAFSSVDSDAIRIGDEHRYIGTPSMGIPVSRKSGESKRRSAVIEFDGRHTLARPSSSRSLKSLSGRPRSSSHKRHQSRHGHQHMKSLKSHGDRAPFQRQVPDGPVNSLLPAFHHDNIIDPDLAPFLSDEGSSEEEIPSIFATLHSEPQSPGKTDIEKSSFASILASVRRGKPWGADKSVGAGSTLSRDADDVSMLSRTASRYQRKRNLSVGSVHHAGNSPRRHKSNNLLNSFTFGHGGSTVPMSPLPKTVLLPINNSKMTRSSSMRGASAPAVELNQASLQHVRRLLRQMLQDAQIEDVKRWERALMPILLQCTDDVNPDIQRNDDIDIRHYIKLKKIPGGKPGDTSYVSGVVFTKNLALKSMLRSIPFPRIAIVTFPIEYVRQQQHFMSLEPVIKQEREYLRNLVKRIAALKPQVLLVEKNVSGLALDFLAEVNIAVVHNVKPSVLNAVARCTQTRQITSVDKLAIDRSQLGKCASFDVKTYVHGTMRKTFIYITGCQKDLGCTIALRGAEMGQLRKLKRITEFMCYVVYNLKLETCVMRDEYVLIPATLTEEFSRANTAADVGHAIGLTEESQVENDRTIIAQAPMRDKPECEGEPPAVTEEVAHRPPTDCDEHKPGDECKQRQSLPAPTPSFYNDIVEKHKTKIISASPFVKFHQPYLLTQAREQEAKLTDYRRLRDQYASVGGELIDEKDSGRFELVQPEMVHRLVQKPSKQVRDYLFAVHNAQYEKALHSYQTQKRQWETYLSGNASLFDPYNHQRIAVLYSMVNTKTSNPCVGPDVIALSFYKEHDLEDDFLRDTTLGQYVEDLCHGASSVCAANACDEPMFNHHHQYVHGEGQMSVIIQKYPSRMRGLHNTILMWSCCRICGQETQVIPMSENTWKYSFGKYLELTFWSTELHPRAHACPHDIHRNHVRYFGFNNFAVRVQYDPVELHEIIVPRATITWKVDSDLHLKNEHYQRFKSRTDRFMDSVKARINSIRVDSVSPEKVDDCQTEVERLKKRANEDHETLIKNLQDKYMESRYYETIPLNRAAKTVHETSIAWDDAFAEFENDFFPSEKDIRRLAQIQINRFLDRDASTASIGSIEETVEDSEMPSPRTIPMDSLSDGTKRTSTLSPEDTENVLASVVQEQSLIEKSSDEDFSLPPSKLESPTPISTASVETPIEALNREDVNHLDLAVSSDLRASPTATATADILIAADGLDGRNSSNASSTITVQSQALELSSHVTETVDQMRANSDLDSDSLIATPVEFTLPETRIPRLADPARGLHSSRTPPAAMSRTRSQPQTMTLSTVYKRDKGSSEAASSSSSTLNAFGQAEKIRSFLDNPAQALGRRMTAGSFRPGRSVSRSLIPRSIPGQRSDSRVSTLKHHFEQLSKEFEKQRMRERQLRTARGSQARAYPLATSKPIVEVYRDAHEAVQENESGDDDESNLPVRDSTDASHLDEHGVIDTGATEAEIPGSPIREASEGHEQDKEDETSAESTTVTGRTSDTEGGEVSDGEQTALEDMEIPESAVDPIPLSPSDSQLDLVELKHEKTSLLKMLTSFWSERSASGWIPLDYPFSPNEHVWGDSDIIVREDEPSSLIALALSSTDYRAKLRSFRNQGDGPMEIDVDKSVERNLLHPKNTNIRYAFQNRGVRAQCKIFYAESFDALRRKCGVADRFVESLSRCLKWDSKGGKTKSLFLKTLDDRFVLKSLSQVEVAAFFKFAPNYFAFMHQNLFHGLPSVIAKMMGLFQVTIRSPGSGLEFNWFMLVMENLFYDRSPNRRFDLKGSMRNRKIQSTGEKDEVLLDENLVDIIFEKPIFVREHTMKLLHASVFNDTLFLSKQNVMDYSLMAGFDDEAKEIIVGIIDCIRTYTWDKKLETWIKDRGKNKPTVTSPKDYRNRFRIAMSKYILQAPNCWHQFPARQIAGRPMRLVKREEEYYSSAGGD